MSGPGFRAGVPHPPRSASESELGRRIIETARARGVLVEDDAALAAALSRVGRGEDIPAALFQAIAQVLAFLARTGGTPR